MRRIPFIVLLLLLVPDVYITFVHQSGWSIPWRLLWWLPTVATMAGIVFSFRWFNTRSFTFIVAMLTCVAIPKLLFALCSVIGKALSFLWPSASFVFNAMGIALAVAFALSMLYGFIYGWRRLKVREVDLEFDTLPSAFDGYRIVQLSDLHMGTLSRNSGFLRKMVSKVNALHADAIVFTGDLVNSSADETRPFTSVLSELNARDGVFSVLGNHDYPLRSPHADIMAESRRLADIEKQMGWQPLLNEHSVISRGKDRIAIVGVENTGKPPFPQIGSLRDAMKGLPADAFPVLLSHDPSHWRMEVLPKTGIPLTLSGHTHAGQLRIGNWSPAKPVYPEWRGLYCEGTRYLYVSEGTGTRVPFRFGTVAEITLITLHHV